MVIITGTFQQAQASAETSAEQERKQIADLLDQWTESAPENESLVAN